MESNTSANGAHGNEHTSQFTNVAASKRSKQDANLRKRGFLRFQLGLIIALVVTYFALEASFRMQDDMVMAKTEDLTEVSWEYHPELTAYKVEQVKEPQVAPKLTLATTFEVLPNDVPIIEAKEFINEPTESATVIPDDIPEVDMDPEVETVPFIALEDGPIFPGCEGVKKEDRLSCFQSQIQKHIQKHIKYPNYEQELGIEGKSFVIFKIDTDGTIRDIEVRSSSKGFEQESERIIEKLPQMTPGKQRGRAVKVPFSIPINFKLN